MKTDVIVEPKNICKNESKKYGKSNNDVKASLSSLTKHIDIIDLKGKIVVDMLEDDWNDYEDGLQFVSAENYKSDFIITRNKKDFSQSSITFLSPQEFLDMVEDD